MATIEPSLVVLAAGMNEVINGSKLYYLCLY